MPESDLHRRYTSLAYVNVNVSSASWNRLLLIYESFVVFILSLLWREWRGQRARISVNEGGKRVIHKQGRPIGQQSAPTPSTRAVHTPIKISTNSPCTSKRGRNSTVGIYRHISFLQIISPGIQKWFLNVKALQPLIETLEIDDSGGLHKLAKDYFWEILLSEDFYVRTPQLGGTASTPFCA